jgi:hypothetical protein
MDPIIARYSSISFDELSWCQNEGIMYQTDMSQSVEYGVDYYEKYVGYESTIIAKKLNEGRTNITSRFCESILDIGVGSGEFIKNSKIKTYGFDINPVAVEWLKKLDLYKDPYLDMPDVDGLTFWDSLEHIPDPNALLCLMQSNQYAFISIPIFDDLQKIKMSKHYRPNEHYYYFTQEGLKKYMEDSGFKFIACEGFEIEAGREDILTFVFRKK